VPIGVVDGAVAEAEHGIGTVHQDEEFICGGGHNVLLGDWGTVCVVRWLPVPMTVV